MYNKMPGLDVNTVVQHLKGQFINAKEDWVKVCVEWAMSNQPPAELSVQKLQEFTYEQWLLADLREVGTGCLPANLADHKLYILPGKYTVQAEEFLDIANPMYSQLKHQRGGNVEVDEEASEEEEAEELDEWGKGPDNSKVKLRSRKLQLLLCDGQQEIRALEYRPLPQLSGMILPGVKLLLCGPLECRRGVLMLEQHHLKVLGGEVDTLVTTNAPENIMARKLGLPENPDPYSGLQTTVGNAQEDAGNMARAQRPMAAVGPLPTQNLSAAAPAKPITCVAPPVAAQPGPSYTNANQPSASPQMPQSTVNSMEISASEMDDFDLTEEDLLALEMESAKVEVETSRAAIQPSAMLIHRPIPLRPPLAPIAIQPMMRQFHNTSVSPFSQVPEQHNTGGDDLYMNRGNEKSVMLSSSVPVTKPSTSLTTAVQASSSCSGVQNDSIPASKPKITAKPEMTMETFSCDKDYEHFSDMKTEQESNLLNKTLPLDKGNDSIPSTSDKVDQNKVSTSVDDLTESVHKDDEVPLNKNKHNQPPTKKLKGGQTDITSFAKKEKSDEIQPSTSAKEKSSTSSSKPNLSKFIETNLIKENEICEATNITHSIDSSPFIYLSQLSLSETKPKSVIVKACVATVIEKLRKINGCWNLKLRLTDGSDNLDVELSDEILSKFIGFTAAQVNTIKVAASENPVMNEKLMEVTQGVHALKQKLIDLICIMKIEFQPNKMPCVVSLETIAEKHMAALQARKVLHNTNP